MSVRGCTPRIWPEKYGTFTYLHKLDPFLFPLNGLSNMELDLVGGYPICGVPIQNFFQVDYPMEYPIYKMTIWLVVSNMAGL
jgi:hypothetical protein